MTRLTNGKHTSVIDPPPGADHAEFLAVVGKWARQLARGEVPFRITGEHHGLLNDLKNDLNTILDVTEMRNRDIRMLIDASLEGQLAVRAGTAKYSGDNAKMMEGVNQVLDAMLQPIGEANRVLAQISAGKI